MTSVPYDPKTGRSKMMDGSDRPSAELSLWVFVPPYAREAFESCVPQIARTEMGKAVREGNSWRIPVTVTFRTGHMAAMAREAVRRGLIVVRGDGTLE